MGAVDVGSSASAINSVGASIALVGGAVLLLLVLISGFRWLCLTLGGSPGSASSTDGNSGLPDADEMARQFRAEQDDWRSGGLG